MGRFADGPARLADAQFLSLWQPLVQRSPTLLWSRETPASMGACASVVDSEAHAFLDHAKAGRFENALEMLIDDPSLLNRQPSKRWSALHQAALLLKPGNGAAELIEEIAHVAGVGPFFQKNPDGDRPLQVAMKHNPAAVLLLQAFEHGVRICPYGAECQVFALLRAGAADERALRHSEHFSHPCKLCPAGAQCSEFQLLQDQGAAAGLRVRCHCAAFIHARPDRVGGAMTGAEASAMVTPSGKEASKVKPGSSVRRFWRSKAADFGMLAEEILRRLSLI